MITRAPSPSHAETDSIVKRRIIAPVQSYMKDFSDAFIENAIWSAYVYAREAHEGQMRKSGDPYIIHPVLSAEILLELSPDITSIQACLLHDVIEDTDRTVEDIERVFGHEVAHICDGLSKLSVIRYRGEERMIGSLRKMLLAMVDDLRVILVKLADRMHNMKTLDHHPDQQKRERIALETLNIYAPIADRLGIFHMKEALENECFRILYPNDYSRITRDLLSLREEQDFFVNTATQMIQAVVPPNIPISAISYRVKSPYSIYKKLERKDFSYRNVSDLYDLFALRIITDTIPHCYELLGVIHNAWSPIPKRFKDYIALPKENGYQSLHTTVIGIFPEVRSQPTEIQIRTEAMHQHAELGVAAHFEYSEKGHSTEAHETYWVRAIQDILKSMDEGGGFMNEMKINVFNDQIFVFTPQGDVITLPKGSTPIDFAYAIHSDVGNKTSIAKVDGRVVPLDYELRSGESVNIIIDIHKRPSLTWLSFVKTARAREVIRQVTNREQRDLIIERGRNILSQYLQKNYNADLDKDLLLLRIVGGHELDMKQREDVLVQLGNLSRKPSSVMNEIQGDVLKRLTRVTPEVETSKPRRKKALPLPTESITPIIGSEAGIPYKLAKCCNPTHNDRIVASVGQGGVTIHRYSCRNMKKIELGRRISCRWSNETAVGTIVSFEILILDHFGVIHAIFDIFYRMRLNVVSIEQIQGDFGQEQRERIVKILLKLSSEDEDYYLYDRIVERLTLMVPEYRSSRLVDMSWGG